MPVKTEFHKDAAAAWSRTAAGRYALTFPAGSFPSDSDYTVGFGNIEGTSGGITIFVNPSDSTTVGVEFRDAAGAFVEADCSFDVMVIAYEAPIPV